MLAVQCKMARAGLGLGRDQLAAMAKVPPEAVVRIERGEAVQEATTRAVRRALEKAGADFLDGSEPGVRIRAGAVGDPSAAIPVEELNASNDE